MYFIGNYLQKNLKVLNVTGLRLTSINMLKCFYRLEELFAAENLFSCLVQLTETLGTFSYLLKVDVHSCPAQKDIHYREKITAGAPQIGNNDFFLFVLHKI